MREENGGNTGPVSGLPDAQTAMATPQPAAPADPATPSQSAGATNPAPAGIYSSGDLSVNTENLPPELGGPQPEQDDQARVASALGGRRAARRGATAAASTNGRIESVVTKDLKLIPSVKKKHSKAPLIIAILVLLIAGAGAAAYILYGKNKIPEDQLVIGTENTAILFDETAPIPVLQDGQYGYINPSNGEWVIQPQYLEAGNFYGQHAIVSYSQANVAKTAIINRSGDIVVVQEGGSLDAYYDIENNIWVVGGTIYNAAMQKVNDESATSTYIGNGYILSSYKTENADNSSNQDVDSDEDTAGATSNNTTISKIVDLSGEIHYDCNAFCSAQAFRDGDGTILAVVRGWGEPAKIISLPAGQVIYTATGDNTIRVQGEDGFIENLEDGNNRHLIYDNGQIITVTSFAEQQESLYGAGEYYAEECNGRNSIFKADGTAILRCSVYTYTELPETVYSVIQQKRSQDLLFVELTDKTELVNLRDATNAIKNYELGDIMTYENSPFFHVYENGNPEVCNLLSEDITCIKIDESFTDIEGFGNYFTVSLPDQTKVYNAKMEMIYEQKD